MLVTVVDGNDQIVGSKSSDELDGRDIYRVSGLWLTNSKGQVLMAKRQLGKRNDPGKWGPAVAGTLEPSETYESNIYKEAKEEIGLSKARFELGPKILNDANPERKFFVQWFLGTIDWSIDKFVIQTDEVAKLAWLDKEFLKQDIKRHPDKYIAGADKVFGPFLI